MDSSQSKDLAQGKDAPDSAGEETREAPKRPLGEYVEGTLADVLGTLSRFITTMFLLAIRPHRAAAQLSKEPPNYAVLARPYTFLLLGCLFYSVLLSAIELSFTPRDKNTRGLSHNEITEVLAAGIQQLLSHGPSLLTLVITTLPILIVASLSAVLAGHIFKHARTKRFFLYLYGLQGSMSLLFGLSMETQGEVLQKLFGSDDYILLVFPALVLALAVQAFRCLRAILDNGNRSGKVVRALTYLAFCMLFLVPIPFSGYMVVGMHQSALQVKKENRERAPGPPIRIVDVTTPTIDGPRMNIELTALVKNRSKLTLVLRPSDVELEVYFVSPAELDRVWKSGPAPSNVDADLDDYDRYRAHLNEARIENGVKGRDIWTLAPTLDGLIRVVASQEVTSLLFRAHARDRWRYKDEDYLTRRQMRAERAQLVVEELEQVPESQRLAYVADGRKVIVRLTLKDHTANSVLMSGFYRLKD